MYTALTQTYKAKKQKVKIRRKLAKDGRGKDNSLAAFPGVMHNKLQLSGKTGKKLNRCLNLIQPEYHP